MSGHRYEAIRKIEAILVRFFGRPETSNDRWRHKAAAAEILLRLKEYARASRAQGKPGWEDSKEEKQDGD